MKTIKTVSGIRKIDNWDDNLIPVQLAEILHEHRSGLITKLLTGLGYYIKYKLQFKVTPSELQEVKEQLYYVKLSGVDMNHYESILEEVLTKDSVVLDPTPFYQEIDDAIKSKLEGNVKVLQEGITPTFNRNDLIIRVRRDMVAKIQTEQGLREYVKDTYKSSIANDVKLLYLLEEVREYFKKEPSDYRWLLTLFRKLEYRDWELGNKSIFDDEMKPILDKHFLKEEKG
jgi:hypothetical protein